MRLLPVLGIGVVGVAIVAAVLYMRPHGEAVNAVAPLSAPAGVTFQTARTGGTILLAMAGSIFPPPAPSMPTPRACRSTPSTRMADGKVGLRRRLRQGLAGAGRARRCQAVRRLDDRRREDGSKQWALHGKPLYTSVKDSGSATAPATMSIRSGIWLCSSPRGAQAAGRSGDPGSGRRRRSGAGSTIRICRFTSMTATPRAKSPAAWRSPAPTIGLRSSPASWPAPTASSRWSIVAMACSSGLSRPAALQLRRGYPTGRRQRQRRRHQMARGPGGPELHAPGRDGQAQPLRRFDPGDDGRHVALCPGPRRRHQYRAQSARRLERVFHGRPHARTASCDAECAKLWKPLVAAPDAQPNGNWEVATREDGVHQWIYRGFAVYSYAKDTKPGDMLGNDEIEIMDKGDPFKMADLGVKGMGALFWHTATP